MTASKSQGPESRRERLLQAAAEVFFEQGYAAASVDAIIARAGGSKRNIYSEFGNKEGLFTAIVRQNSDEALATLPIDVQGDLSLQQSLTAFGRHLMAVYMSPAVIGVYQIVVTEAKRFPELVRTFYEQGPGRTTRRLAEVLEAARSRDLVRIDDCELAAGHFVGMIRDNLHLQVVLGLRAAPTKAEAEAAVASAVDVFLHGICAERTSR
ncbi:TetR/AcrR family transcriptional regulator [Aurantimonas sp. VKM B-3413]|uniref:TetR/AcrR family transcriptional regulator n=1 Tax=Aurantimonas sp. VKM B-3413 TaxID=2779401 RepID=UPI001E59CE69|nr:TetR/AcrR family transcriptional regulator [Aurantimonas sp. VKM B-3413]MCB8840224.1 TetR/AcrR family transcriptional regulator [Aurantimonas sp. VKM B-3413]